MSMSIAQAYDPKFKGSLLDVGPPTQEQDVSAEEMSRNLSKLGMDVEGAEASGTFGIGDQYYVLPTQMQGVKLSPDESRMLFQHGLFLGGPFDSEGEAQSWEKDFLGYVGGK